MSQAPKPAHNGAPPGNTFIENANVRLMTLIAVVLFAGGGIWQLANLVSSQKAFNAELKRDIASIKTSMADNSNAAGERLRYILSEFCRRTERKNPNWQCPDPIITSDRR